MGEHSPKLYVVFLHVKGEGKRAVWTPATGPHSVALLSSTARGEDIRRECEGACLAYGFDGYRTGWGRTPTNLAWNGRVKKVPRDNSAS